MNEEKPCVLILEGTLREGGLNSPEFKEYSKRSNANGEHMGVLYCRDMWSAKTLAKVESQILSS